MPRGVRYAVEVRHRSWIGSDLPTLLRENGVALTLIDYPAHAANAGRDLRPGVRPLARATGASSPRATRIPKRDRAEDLAWWAEKVRGFLSEGREVFAYANNHYQNHSPSTLRQFLQTLRAGR